MARRSRHPIAEATNCVRSVLAYARAWALSSQRNREAMKSKEKFTADEFKELLGPPRLIRGESEEAYWKWWSAFVAAYNPERSLEWFQLNHYATKTWEQQR